MPLVSRFFTRGRLRHRSERRYVGGLLKRFEVLPNDPSMRLSELSGGNQQKVLLAKWLQLEPIVQLLYEPTQGIDVGSRRQMFHLIHGLAQSGTGVVIASAEYGDLAHLCTRVLVFRNGRVAIELSGADLTKESITEQCLISKRQAA